MAIKQLSDGNPSGTNLGQSATDLVGFYGLTTPIAQPAVTAVGTTTATTALNETRISRLYTAMENLNLIRTTS